jgi:NAD(P)H-dependent FMN reductase
VLDLKIVVGSTREGRAADRVVPWIARRAESNPAFRTEIVDLRVWALPLFEETVQTIGDFADPTYSQPLIRQWNDLMRDADAYVVVTPEYNHSVPGVLKNAIDSLFFSFALRHKPVGAIGYSGGPVGGARAVEHLAQILVEGEAVPLRNTVLIPAVQNAFAEDGEPTDPATDLALDILLEDLEWWARVLAGARPTSLPHALMRRNARTGVHQRAS